MYTFLSAIVAGLVAFLLPLGTRAQQFDIPAGVTSDHIITRFEFNDGSTAGWGAAPTDMTSILLRMLPGAVRLTLQPSGNDESAWIDSPPMGFIATDTTHVVMRLRSALSTSVAHLQLLVSDDVPPLRSQRTLQGALNGTVMEQPFALLPDGAWHTYHVPIFSTRERVPSVAARIARMRFVPAVGNARLGSVDIDWIRVVNAPTLVRVQGCQRLSAPSLAPFGSVARMPWQVALRWGSSADQYFASLTDAAQGLNPQADAALPFAATYACALDGGDVIMLTGHHMGDEHNPPQVYVGGAPCTNVTVVLAQRQVQCILPPGAGQHVPVRVVHPATPGTFDEEQLVSYAPHDVAPRVRITNINARAVTLNIFLTHTWAAMCTTGYTLEWQLYEEAVDGGSGSGSGSGSWGNFADAFTGGGRMVVGNVSVTTVRSLLPGRAYRFRAAAIIDSASQQEGLARVGLYGERSALPNSVLGPWSEAAQVTTLGYDFMFSRFDVNSTLAHGPVHAAASLDQLLWAGGEGHYGLVLVGSAQIGNCNATHTCCDNFGGANFAYRLRQFISSTRQQDAAAAGRTAFLSDRFEFDARSLTDSSLPATLREQVVAHTVGNWFSLSHDESAWDMLDDAAAVTFVSPLEFHYKLVEKQRAEARAANVSDEEYIFGVRFNEEAGAQETTPLQLLVDSVGRQYVPISKPPAEECTAICAAAPYVRLSQLNLEPNSGEAVAPSSLPGLLESPASLASDVDVNTHYNESDREAAFTSRASSGSLSAQFVRDVWAAGADLTAAAPSPASLSPQQVVRRVVNGSAAYNNSSSSARPTAPCGPILRLTGAHPDQTGAAWYGRAQQVREGFDTTFLFRMSSPSRVCRYMDDMYTHCRSRGAGGFAFVVQAWHPTAMGRGYEGLGYADIRNSVAIEFDTNADAGLYEPHENHVSVHTRGAAAGNSASHSFSLGATRTAKLPDLAEGIHTARIVYQPVWDPAVLESPAFDISSPLVAHFFTNAEYASGGLPQWSAGLELISVYVNDDTQPVLIVPINLRATLDIAGSHGRAWVGFTAATGENMWQTHDILAWQFTQLRM